MLAILWREIPRPAGENAGLRDDAQSFLIRVVKKIF
jgi:hypothetical protein